jgi:hypothetical protein
MDGETSFVYTSTSGDIVIKAEDKASGIDRRYVYISDYQLSSQELKGIYIWTEYEPNMAIPVNTPKFVYVKVVDRAGNETYVGSDGVIFDNIAPKINLDEDTVYFCDTGSEEYGNIRMSGDGLMKIGVPTWVHTIGNMRSVIYHFKAEE